MYVRDANVAQPAPVAPIGAKPRFPKMKIQLAATLIRFSADQHDHHPTDQAHALQVAPKSREEHQRRDTPDEGFHIGPRQSFHRAIDAEGFEKRI